MLLLSAMAIQAWQPLTNCTQRRMLPANAWFHTGSFATLLGKQATVEEWAVLPPESGNTLKHASPPLQSNDIKRWGACRKQ